MPWACTRCSVAQFGRIQLYIHVYARCLGDYTRYIYTFNAQQKGKLDRGMRLWDLKWQHTREGGQHVASGYSVVRAGIGQLTGSGSFPRLCLLLVCLAIPVWQNIRSRSFQKHSSAQPASRQLHTVRLWLKSAPKYVEQNGVSSCGIEF